MAQNVAIVGAGVSGLTCAVVFAERGYRTTILTQQIGTGTTSAAAAAIWYPYDAEPIAKTIVWALETYETLVELIRDRHSGVSMLELRRFSRSGEIEIPKWAEPLGARKLRSNIPAAFSSGFAVDVPLMDTTVYLDYLAQCFAGLGGKVETNKSFTILEEVGPEFNLVINCTGIGARALVSDDDLEPHRGQVAILPKLNSLFSVVCDDDPLLYIIPRQNDCVLGGTNDLSNDLTIDSAATIRMVAECSLVLGINKPEVLSERVGIRPFRRSGVRIERARLSDGRPLIHNYGHGGSGFTLSWGCAELVARIAQGEDAK